MLYTKIGIEACDLHFWPQVRVLQGASQDSRKSPKYFFPPSEGLVVSPFTSSPPVKREKFRCHALALCSSVNCTFRVVNQSNLLVTGRPKGPRRGTSTGMSLFHYFNVSGTYLTNRIRVLPPLLLPFEFDTVPYYHVPKSSLIVPYPNTMHL